MIPAEARAAVMSIVRGVLGMEITHKPRLRAVAAQFLLGIAGLAFITFVCFQFGFGLARTAFAYLILITLVSLLGSLSTCRSIDHRRSLPGLLLRAAIVRVRHNLSG